MNRGRQLVLMSEPDGAHEVLIERVHAAVADEAQQMERPAAALHAGAQLDEGRQPEKLARLDGLRDAHDVLRDDAAGPEVQVSHFTVADLALGKTHGEPRRAEQRAGRVRPEPMPDGGPPELDGVALPTGTEAPAVEHDQDDRGADRKSTRLNSSHGYISYAVFCLKKKKKQHKEHTYIRHKNIRQQ